MKLFHPKKIDFYAELKKVENYLVKVDKSDIQNAYNYNNLPHLEFQPVMFTLFSNYSLTMTQRTRILGYINAALNDAVVITWYYKFKYDIPRPNQLNLNLKTLICTPYHPAYPSGHSVLGGLIVELFSLLFPKERDQLDKLYEDLKRARFQSGVHFEVDSIYGEPVGRNFGKYIYNIMKKETDIFGEKIDVFKTPAKKPDLKVDIRKDIEIFTCNSLIDERSLNYAKGGYQ